jgi:hypothetical protein
MYAEQAKLLCPTDRAIQAATFAHTQELFDPAWDTEQRIATMEQVDAGRLEAYFLPVVSFTGRVAIDLCTEPDLIDKLPREVSDRGAFAGYVAGKVALNLIAEDAFSVAYNRDPILKRGLEEHPILRHNLRDPRHLKSNCSAPFKESAWIAGGAYDMLKYRGFQEDGRADIIARSTPLLLAASISKKYQKDIFEFMGTPYAHRDHFRVDRGDNRRHYAGYTDKTKRFLQACTEPRRGCPAAAIRLGDKECGVNTLKQAWADIIYYLLYDQPEVTIV